MVNLFIQILILSSGLLINFLIPILFGLEKYGLFIKANILVFLFHKFADIISEPLISNIDKAFLFPISIIINLILICSFSICNHLFPIGNLWLLISMLWSNSVLLVMYSHGLRYFILMYLATYILIFIALTILTYLHFTTLSITSCLILTNFIPSILAFIVINLLGLLEINFHLYFTQITSMVVLIPRLFSYTLMSNLFTNIIPFYASFIFSPQTLAFFRIQVSIVQSVTAIFPLNNKVISTLLQNTRDNYQNALNGLLTLSMNYFYILTILFFVATINFNCTEYAKASIISPIMHVCIIMERYLLTTKMKNTLILINCISALAICIAALWVSTMNQMILLYATGTSLYLLLMLLVSPNFRLKKVMIYLALSSPLILSLTIKSNYIGIVLILICLAIIFQLNPINKKSIAILKM